MLWLVLVFAWLAVTVLRDRRQRFVSGALARGALVVAALNVLNPDAFIVQTNLDRDEQRPFDHEYAMRLSPDATPTIVAALPRLPADQQCAIAAGLAAPDAEGWRAWNLSREQARRASERLDEVRSACR